MVRARFFEASSSGVIMSVGLAVALGVPVTVGVIVAAGVPLDLPPPVLDMTLGVLAFTVATAALPPAFEPLCSWPSLHPAMPEQASRVKASAACRYRLFVEAPIVFPHVLSTLMKL